MLSHLIGDISERAGKGLHFSLSSTYNLQQTTISNFAAFSKITNKKLYFMRIVC